MGPVRRSLITMTTFSRSSSLLALLLILAALSGCSKPDRSSSPPPPTASAPVAAAPANGGEIATAALPAAAERSLVVTMNVAIIVDRVPDAMTRITTSARQAGGYVADQNVSANANDGEQSAHLELRVPADKAAGFRSSLGDLGEVTSANEKMEDVTEQRADIEARLRSARIQEKRLLEILGQKGGTIQDLLETEKELARIRENVERLEAQDHVMKSKIALATIHVNLATKSTPAWQTPGTSLVRSGKLGVRGAAAVAVYSGMALFTIAPTLLPMLAVAFGVIMIVRRRRRAYNNAVVAQQAAAG
jgi:hypothetical protein